jgi:hypothetical protein
MPTFVWNKCGRKHPCFRRSQFRLCPENGRISVDIEAMSNNDMLAELQQFPPLEPPLALLQIAVTCH